MKKLIAISVMLVLLTGAAFAQVSGTVQTRLNLLQTSDLENEDLTIGGSIGAAHIQLTGANSDGTLGGLFRFRNTDVVRADAWFHRVFVWWRPIPELRVFLGIDQDGMFGTDALAGWAFHQGDNDYMFVHDWGLWRNVFPGNWDGYGLALSYAGIENLSLNLVLPTGGLGYPQATQAKVQRTVKVAEFFPGYLRFMGSFRLEDLGTIYFTYNGPEADITNKPANYGQLGASFLMSGAIPGVNIQLGGSFVIPGETNDGAFAAGLGLHYAGDGFGVKFRAAATMELKDDSDIYITANLMPHFALSGVNIFFDVGIAMQGDNMGWWVTPVLRVPMGGGLFSAGVTVRSGINSNGNQGVTSSDKIYLNVPMLLQFSF